MAFGRGDFAFARGDTTLSLLPSAGEGGRRPDEGAVANPRRLVLVSFILVRSDCTYNADWRIPWTEAAGIGDV